MDVSRRDFFKLGSAAATGTALPLEDLATVDLDLAALEHGYVRPDGPPFRLAVRVVARRGRIGSVFGRGT